MAIDQEAIRFHIRGILEALGDDPEREGLKDTPERVARMYTEMFAGMNYSNHEIAEMFGKTFTLDAGSAERKNVAPSEGSMPRRASRTASRARRSRPGSSRAADGSVNSPSKANAAITPAALSGKPAVRIRRRTTDAIPTCAAYGSPP